MDGQNNELNNNMAGFQPPAEPMAQPTGPMGQPAEQPAEQQSDIFRTFCPLKKTQITVSLHSNCETQIA